MSCLCVTENRAPFMPWLLWSYDRQTWPNKELVIIDSSPVPFASARADVRVIALPPGTYQSAKRNRALDEARGDGVAWFDDDDWQHPERLARLAQALGAGADIAGGPDAWLVDLFHGTCARHVESAGLFVFNSAGFRRDLAQSQRFDEIENIDRANLWAYTLQFGRGAQVKAIDGAPGSVLLCHGSNLTNHPGRWVLAEPIDSLRAALGAPAWGQTDRQLDDLRSRILASQLPPPAAMPPPGAATEALPQGARAPSPGAGAANQGFWWNRPFRR
jgi:hypothetical protein